MSLGTPSWWKLSARSTRSSFSRLTPTRSLVNGPAFARLTVRERLARLWAAPV
ncbi:hypothetical protein E2C01_090804 [Portunus trituberculatus]|uniref:Uncharacterized protein n=1 Tax=Portunus trituberculatus TaxID=210409 RepID=A0A5B7JMR0_PORTR|nr:hypothetical protein [Portunus trituberculatus]